VKSVRDLVLEASTKIEAVSPTDAQAELEAGTAVFVDVREPVEWEHHIEGAYQIPRGLLEFVSDPECGPRLPPSLKYDLEPTRRVIIYCNSGARGALAALSLQEMGYERVANLDGGISAWREAGLPVKEHHGGL
jgi:rhodanese-related sulfurtransferase